MTSFVVRTAGAEGSRAVARALARHLRAGDLLVMDGPLGAGKTTFTQGLGAAMGVRGQVASPTFVIARVHPALADGPALVHVDAYRLSGGFDIEDLDLDAELDDAVTVIEWGRDRVEHLAASHLLVELDREVQPVPVVDGRAEQGGDAIATESEALVDGAEEVDEPLAGDEPRTLTFTPAGPRWTPEAVAALAADLESAAAGELEEETH